MNPFELLKNMNEIKSQAEAMKAKVATIRCTGYAGGNMVQAVANGKMEIESVTIDPEFAKAENTQLLEVMVTSAVNTALANVRERIQEEAGNAMAQYGIGL
ncbi:MAG: YbaB/EbfC family nucleoid-associated protein [Spirochaetales bacterium]|jgi:DNA-binding YbaB/EbfC family protein|nr:YbaB/EbfC family nucleoid-associated protein [Spirochaetales bacterium]MBR6348280.1 YbaB/EbfC family nucleoid-associated protein [Spirochaetales bacterium]